MAEPKYQYFHIQCLEKQDMTSGRREIVFELERSPVMVTTTFSYRTEVQQQECTQESTQENAQEFNESDEPPTSSAINSEYAQDTDQDIAQDEPQPSTSNSGNEETPNQQRRPEKRYGSASAGGRVTQNAYFNFIPEIRVELGNISRRQITREAARRWNSMTAQEKEPYREMARSIQRRNRLNKQMGIRRRIRLQ